MSSFYTTKSLGKDWLPSPVRGSRGVSGAGRYGTYPALDSPKWRSSHSYADGLNRSSSNKRSWSRWSKFHERIALAIALIVLICLFHDNLQQRIENFRYNIYAFTHSSSTTSVPPSVPVTTDPAWAHFAYNFFAHDSASLCSAVVHLRSLQRANSKPTRLLSYPSLWTSAGAPLEDSVSRLLKRAEQEYGAVLQPVPIPIPSSILTSGNSVLMSEYGKLLPFNQTQFSRVAYVDTSIPSTLLKPLDDIFQFSEAAIAMPRAYWDIANPTSLSDLLLLIQPDALTFERLVSHFSADPDGINLEIEQQQQSSLPPTFMTVVNKLFDEATFLPHRDFLLRTSEFKRMDHSAYLGSFDAIWDAKNVIEEAKYVVFSDGDEQQQAAPPDCSDSNAQSRTSGGVATCAEREIWEWLRRDYRDRRMAVCGALADESRSGQTEQQEDVAVEDAVSSTRHLEAQNKIIADQEETERLLSQDMPELQVG
ncbi:putative nucleotide-diphospho-sugar transferase, glucose N-acetyltransferase 1 [Septoria linicola]|nr:putative nucleotide-diphospho-sugar transferase, glucose N-acetyltransferase 1 [Septoria linicola]